MLCVSDQKCGVTVTGLREYGHSYLSCSEYLRLPLENIPLLFSRKFNYLVSILYSLFRAP